MAKHMAREDAMGLIKLVDKYKSEGMSKSEACKKAGIKKHQYEYFRQLSQDQEPAREIVRTPGNGHSQELKMLRIENQRLRMIVSEQALDIQSLKEYVGRSK